MKKNKITKNTKNLKKSIGENLIWLAAVSGLAYLLFKIITPKMLINDELAKEKSKYMIKPVEGDSIKPGVIR